MSKGEITKINKEKYLKQPTTEQILDFIKTTDVSYRQFERFFGIPTNTIKQVLRTKNPRPLPAKYWHFFYEKKIPTYGVGYQKNLYKAPSKTGTKVGTKSAANKKVIAAIQQRINGNQIK